MVSETEELTRKVEALLEEGTLTEIANCKLPNMGMTGTFRDISSAGLDTLRRSELVLKVARTDYSPYPRGPEDYI